MVAAMLVTSSQMWKLAPALALKRTLPDPGPFDFERFDAQVVGP
jgi:hypothetical protein